MYFLYFTQWIYAASREAISAINNNISQVSNVFHFELRSQDGIDWIVIVWCM